MLYNTALERLEAKSNRIKSAYDSAVLRAEQDPEYKSASATMRSLIPLAAKGERIEEYLSAKEKVSSIEKKLGITPPLPLCKLCNDTGYLDGKPCSCLLQEINFLIEESVLGGLPAEDFSKARYDLFGESKIKFFRAVYDEAQKLAKNPNSIEQRAIVYCGKTGTGKSHLAKCLASELKKNGKTALCFPAYSFFDLLSGLYKNEDKRVILSALVSSDLLVVDDLGCEACGEYARNVFISVLSSRIENGKLTVFTTNLIPKDLQNVYGERVLSRLLDKQKSKIYLFEGKDTRLSK